MQKPAPSARKVGSQARDLVAFLDAWVEQASSEPTVSADQARDWMSKLCRDAVERTDKKAVVERQLRPLSDWDEAAQRYLAVAALYNGINDLSGSRGSDEVRPEHLEIAQHCLWDDPVEQPQKAAQVIARIANPVGMRVTQLLLEIEQVLAAADVRNLADAAKAAAKLAEIDRQLATLKGNGRVEKARSYLKDQLKKLKLASIEAV